MDVYGKPPQASKLEVSSSPSRSAGGRTSQPDVLEPRLVPSWGCHAFSDETLSQAALSAAQHRRFARALVILNYLIARSPSATHYSNRGMVYLWSGQAEMGLADCDRAISLDPNMAQAYNNRGNCYAALERWSKAIADYERAIDLNPFNVRARINLGITLRDLEQYNSALEAFEEAMLFQQLAEHIYVERGRTYHLLGDWNCAIADYNRALSLLSRTESATTARLQERVQGWLSDLLPLS
ncbi:MAG: tetratricopeptide repeat protein [Cyanobacteria bacterium Co-bin8]|nr:tetratricopeptide repeat protein [Cyanobacteria bacterium Co-bin8]